MTEDPLLDVGGFATHHFPMNDTFTNAADTGALKVIITAAIHELEV